MYILCDIYICICETLHVCANCKDTTREIWVCCVRTIKEMVLQNSLKEFCFYFNTFKHSKVFREYQQGYRLGVKPHSMTAVILLSHLWPKPQVFKGKHAHKGNCFIDSFFAYLSITLHCSHFLTLSHTHILTNTHTPTPTHKHTLTQTHTPTHSCPFFFH